MVAFIIIYSDFRRQQYFYSYFNNTDFIVIVIIALLYIHAYVWFYTQ